MNVMENRYAQTFLFGVLPLTVGLWILTWIPHKDTLPSWLAGVVGAILLLSDVGAATFLARSRVPQGLLPAWRLLVVCLTAGGTLFAALLSRYLGASVPAGQILLAVGLIAVLFFGMFWTYPVRPAKGF